MQQHRVSRHGECYGRETSMHDVVLRERCCGHPTGRKPVIGKSSRGIAAVEPFGIVAGLSFVGCSVWM